VKKGKKEYKKPDWAARQRQKADAADFTVTPGFERALNAELSSFIVES